LLLFSFLIFLGFWSTPIQSKEKFTEKWLIENIKANGLSPLETQYMRAQGDEIQLRSESAYSLMAGGSGSIYRSNADSSNSFQPAIRNSHGWDVYASKGWSAGLNTKLGIKNDYSKLSGSTGDIISHSPTYYLQLQLSLFQNFLGRMDQAMLQQGRIAKETLELQSTMAEHNAITSARTLYWSIMGNSISTNLSRSLISTSKKQLDEIRKRYKSGAAEQADVYLSEAQVSQRESSLIGLQIKEQGYLRQLRLMAPGIGNISSADFPTIDIEDVVGSVSECIVQISSHPKAPYQYSSYEKMFSLFKQTMEAEQTVASYGLGPEVSLSGEIQSKGVDTNFSEAFSETNKLSKGGWGATLGLTVPLGSNASALTSTKRKLSELNELKSRRELELLLDGTHNTALTSIQYLLESMRTLDASTRALAKRVSAVQKKYRQGRIDFLSLVQEQDQLFNAEIGLTESRLLFLRELFNYLSVYNKTPCDFNLAYATAEM